MPASDADLEFEVRVELKPGVFDAEADSIAKSLGLLGIAGLSGVATARIYRLRFRPGSPEEARRQVDRAVERLLANPVIHRVAVRRVGADADA